MWRHAIVIVLALPGAFFGSVWGFLIGSFAGDASPHPIVFKCLVLGLVCAGGSLGALPGILAGILLQVRWVIPVLAACLGALVTAALILAAQSPLGHIAQFDSITAFVVALGIFAPIAIGSVIGVFCYRAVIRNDRDRQRAAPPQTAEPTP